MSKEIYVLIIAVGLIVYGVSQFMRGYKYNKHLQEEDQRTGNYVNGNGSILDEFFRILAPYFPLKIAKYFKMLLGLILIFLGGSLVLGFISDL
ncbi:hypothetical protein V7139_24320 [Neobacillus drentensis]